MNQESEKESRDERQAPMELIGAYDTLVDEVLNAKREMQITGNLAQFGIRLENAFRVAKEIRLSKQKPAASN